MFEEKNLSDMITVLVPIHWNISSNKTEHTVHSYAAGQGYLYNSMLSYVYAKQC